MQISPIHVYNDSECVVRIQSKVVPFSQESLQTHVGHLQSCAGLSLLNVTDILKLLKSHNVALSDN